MLCLGMVLWLSITAGYGDVHFSQKLSIRTDTSIIVSLLFIMFYTAELLSVCQVSASIGFVKYTAVNDAGY